MKRTLLSSLASLFLAVCLLQYTPQMVAAAQSDPRKQEATMIYQISADGKTKKAVAELPMMHRASISPSGKYVYTEKIGYDLNDAVIPYVYSLQTKKLSQLSGLAAWSPKQDILYVIENGGIVGLNPADGKKTVLVEAVPAYPVTDLLVSPDEQYMAFTRKDEQSKDPSQQTHLYLQHLPSLKMKINDRFAAKKLVDNVGETFYWLPNSKKLFYRTAQAIKELDLPTGLKYVHQMQWFPSYSNDMKYRYVLEEKEEYMLGLQTGKKIMLQKQAQPIMEGSLATIWWSPAGHDYAAEQHLRPSNSQDQYYIIRSQQASGRVVYPFGTSGTSNLSPYLNMHDNVRIIGWAKNGQSYYVADLADIHFFTFSLEKQKALFSQE